MKTDASRVTSSTGIGRSSTAFTRLKMAVLAPIPSASDSAATTVNAGLRTSIRMPYLMSWIMAMPNDEV